MFNDLLNDNLKIKYDFDNRILDCDRIKKEIEGFKPLSKDILKQLKEYYRISLTYSSNAIEGNTLTESETKIVLEDGITIGGKSLRDPFFSKFQNYFLK